MSDKRTVSTDALETLGTIIGEGEKRDAIHLAVAPVVAMEKLYPGQDVGLVEGGAGVCDKPLGIVDPFLKAPVFPGQRFWLVVYPRQIQSLRHVWSHPAFADEPGTPIEPHDDKVASEKWLRNWIADADCPNYETVMSALKTTLEGGTVASPDPEDYSTGFEWDDCLFFQGTDAHEEIPPEFWKHVQIVLGVEIPEDKQVGYFSCSC